MIPIISNVLGIAETVIDKAIPDKGKAAEMKHELSLALLKSDEIRMKAQSDVIKTEIASKSWLASNWRPITMMMFVFLVTMHWFGYTPENITEAEVLELLNIVKWGLGGYIGGRSIEKIVPTIADAYKNKHK